MVWWWWWWWWWGCMVVWGWWWWCVWLWWRWAIVITAGEKKKVIIYVSVGIGRVWRQFSRTFLSQYEKPNATSPTQNRKTTSKQQQQNTMSRHHQHNHHVILHHHHIKKTPIVITASATSMLTSGVHWGVKQHHKSLLLDSYTNSSYFLFCFYSYRLWSFSSSTPPSSSS